MWVQWQGTPDLIALQVTIEMLMGKKPFPVPEISSHGEAVRTDYPVSKPDNHEDGTISLKEMLPTLASMII